MMMPSWQDLRKQGSPRLRQPARLNMPKWEGQGQGTGYTNKAVPSSPKDKGAVILQQRAFAVSLFQQVFKCWSERLKQPTWDSFSDGKSSETQTAKSQEAAGFPKLKQIVNRFSSPNLCTSIKNAIAVGISEQEYMRVSVNACAQTNTLTHPGLEVFQSLRSSYKAWVNIKIQG